MSESTNKPKSLPLHLTVNDPRAKRIRVLLNGKHDSSVWFEVDILGCWGVRLARTADGNPIYDKNLDGETYMMTEKVHGFFSFEWLPEVDPDADLDYSKYIYMGGLF